MISVVMSFLLFSVFIQEIDRTNARRITVRDFKCRQNPLFVLNVQHDEEMCVFWSKDRLNFTDSIQACKGMGAGLAMFKTQNRISILKSNAPGDTWIGLDDLKSEGTYVWQDGTVLNLENFRKWFVAGEPNNDWGKQDCICLWNGMNGLDDNQCSKTLFYVCEKPVYFK